MVNQTLPVILVIICALQISAATTKLKSHYNELADRISSLPGQPKVNFEQYSGYITIDEKQERSYFYYFVEAETEPASKPLVLWLNGGPGCSSLGAGAFSEHGPFQPSGNVLVRNNYSWNKVANMIYLESPAGVGFSYSSNKSFYQSVNDEMTARDNLIFLEKWFAKFPEFNNREFYITGESYAGHYVPQLANLIIQSKPKFMNLTGIAIGNPLLEFNTDFNSRAEYLWSHGLISDFTYNQFTFVCNYSQIRRQSDARKLTPECSRVIKQVSSEISGFVDAYDVTLDVCFSSAVSLQSQSLYKLQDEPKIDVCVEDETDVYLNRKDVQKALHARLVGVKKWSVCSDVLHYEMQNLEIPTIGILGSLVESGLRVLVYSGDQDSVLPLTGTRTLVNGLAKDLKLNTTQPYSAWFEGRQVAGWTQAYSDFLSFATIRGASHEAPFSQPERSLVLFSSFIAGKPLPRVNGSAKSRDSLVRLI
ncbi:serine carboxypeptidase-like 45 [Phtheirospermum japonicum]|uniref:Carboxypeptidase n=1 Tax=Phtheirospermum japonicum TaxID=374723 RepID=A0A830BIS2_9LAMI|nr:serine carboxypeptidase-like 45 [Phtheirospermum japonicum]